MAKVASNLVQAAGNVLKAASTTINVGSQLVLDSSELLNNSIGSAPAVTKALLQSPFAAAKGYIMESEGVSEQEAEERAYKYLKQELSRTITDAGEGSGKLLADLFKEEQPAADVVGTKH